MVVQSRPPHTHARGSQLFPPESPLDEPLKERERERRDGGREENRHGELKTGRYS